MVLQSLVPRIHNAGILQEKFSSCTLSGTRRFIASIYKSHHTFVFIHRRDNVRIKRCTLVVSGCLNLLVIGHLCNLIFGLEDQCEIINTIFIFHQTLGAFDSHDPSKKKEKW